MILDTALPLPIQEAIAGLQGAWEGFVLSDLLLAYPATEVEFGPLTVLSCRLVPWPDIDGKQPEGWQVEWWATTGDGVEHRFSRVVTIWAKAEGE